MKVLINTDEFKPEEIYENKNKDLFVQVAASFGCGNDLYINGKQLKCARACEDCKVDQIKLAFDFHKGRMTTNDVIQHDTYIDSHNLYAPQYCAPQKIPYRKIA